MAEYIDIMEMNCSASAAIARTVPGHLRVEAWMIEEGETGPWKIAVKLQVDEDVYGAEGWRVWA